MNERTSLKQFEQFLPVGIEKKKNNGIVYAVVYTRVSSLEQFQNNGSLESQEKICTRLAEQMKLPILARFGGTYESAKSEERKEFKRMMDFVKNSKENIRFIIVSDTDRFSRTGPNAIFLTAQLREKGIQVVAASSPLDSLTPIGAFQQNIQLLFSHFDNQLRREKTVRGMIQKFEKGYYFSMLPMGYERIKAGNDSKIVINKTGQAIAKAFVWKAEEGMRSSEIAGRLNKLGINIREKQLSRIFRNMFYCGLLSNSMLNGKIVEGQNWEPLVTKETFLKANDVLKLFHKSHDYNKENEHVPLRNFISCAKCGVNWTGYIVKKKGLHYYKCNTVGCKCNMSAKKLHTEFVAYLHNFEVNSSVIAPLKKQLQLTFEYMNQALYKQKEEVLKKKNELLQKIESVEEKFIEGDIEKELYQKYHAKYESQLAELAGEEEKQQIPLSNSENFVVFSISLCQNLSKIWASGSLDSKMKLQKIVFPEGLSYDLPNHTYRTKRVNSVILQVSHLAKVLAENKKGNSSNIEMNSLQVPQEGIEPPRPKAHDFESCASTSSAKKPFLK